MATWVWILIAIAVVVVIALVVLGMVRRRTSMLRQRFGPEYDRTVEVREDRRAAEGELRARERQRAQLTIKPLPEATRLRFAKEWRDVQERFVDQPSQAVAAADTLITRVMEERGYPTTQFEAQADVVSVDHPDLVENYRFGHAVWQRSQSQEISTEELREALLRYRSLFDELLQPDAAQAAATGAGQSGTAPETPAPLGDEAGDTAARSTERAAAPTADAAAGEPRDPAYQDQTAPGGSS